jgi:hypothetical protein
MTAGTAYEQQRAAEARLLKWLRRQVNADLRYWRSEPGVLPPARYASLVADCKARLDMLRWAEDWARIREPGVLPDSDRVRGEMLAHLALVMGAVRKLAQGYRDRDGWRDEWNTR